MSKKNAWTELLDHLAETAPEHLDVIFDEADADVARVRRGHHDRERLRRRDEGQRKASRAGVAQRQKDRSDDSAALSKAVRDYQTKNPDVKQARAIARALRADHGHGRADRVKEINALAARIRNLKQFRKN